MVSYTRVAVATWGGTSPLPAGAPGLATWNTGTTAFDVMIDAHITRETSDTGKL